MHIFWKNRDNRERDFEHLFREMYPRLVRFSMTLIDDQDEAKDVVADVMCKALDIFEDMEMEALKGWLYTTTRNSCLNVIKHKKVENSHADFIIEATRFEMNNNYREHEALLQKAENIAKALSEPTCTILRMCYWEKKSYKEVASELGISVDTVNKHISKALRILREAMLINKQ